MRALLVASWMLVALPASADVAPPNQCSKAGDACDTAGPNYKSHGVCVTQTCSKTLPGPNGVQTHTYDCNLCMLPEQAPKAAAAAPATGAGTAKACAVGHDAGGAGSSALVLLGFALVALRRRAR